MIGHLDCSTGISGDKFLGALIGAGFAPEELARGLRPLGLADAVRVVPRASGGIAAVGIEVADLPDLPARTWVDIRELVSSAPLPDRVRERALVVLGLLAEAEAAVHGVALDDVHFHEIGAADTLVDVIGVVLGLEALGIERLTCSPVALGSGTVATAHGVLPVPAPATARLLHGVPCYGGAVEGELTTPTGAALVRGLAESFGALPAMTLAAVGVGAGTRDLGVPNVAQLLVGETSAAASAPSAPGTAAVLVAGLDTHVEPVVVLETNVDHLSPEALAHAAAQLPAAGALDVWQTPIVMKKGRAAVLVSALALPEEAPRVAARMIAELGSLGVRVSPTERLVAERRTVTVRTTFGPLRVKVWEADGVRGLRPEHDDVARVAAERGMAHAEVSDAVAEQARASLGFD